MWKKTWLLGILMTATALSGCSSCGDNGAGLNPGGVNTDGGGGGGGGGGSDGGGGGTTDGGGSTGEPTLGALSIEPVNPILTATGTTSSVRGFTVRGTFSDGHTEDLTSRATFKIDDTRLGTFSGSTFSSVTNVGGASTVRARVDTMSVSTGITVKLDQKVSDAAPGSSTLPPEPDTKFGGVVESARKPRIVYPNSGVLVPPNLGQLEIHFLPGSASNSLFELRFSNTITDVKVYLRCYRPSGVTLVDSTGCIYTPEEKVWKFLAESNRGGQDVRMVLRATDDSGTAGVGVSDPIAVQFARSELRGALYYWTTKPSAVGVVRYDFAGTESKPAESVLTANNIQEGVSCVGCHALSRNGKSLVAEVNGQNDGRLALVDLATWDTTTTPKTALRSNRSDTNRLSTFEAWNPDGTRFVGVYGDSGSTWHGLKLFNGTNAAYESRIAGTETTQNFASPPATVSSSATHPDWSADGKVIAYTSPLSKETNQRQFQGAIKMVTAQTDGSWGAPVTVVPHHDPTSTGGRGKHRYYPAISPDNTFLVYNESTCNVVATNHYTCNGDTDQSARLWAAKLEPDAVRVELARANQGGVMDGTTTNLTNSYPKWSPFVTRGNNGDSSRLMWVTFSSARNFGLRKTAPASGENELSTLLWMAAVDPDKVGAGLDPSYPAFALPFQDLNTSNHIAQWAQYLVSNGCSVEGESCGTCCNGLQCVATTRDPPIPCTVEGACVCQAIPQCKPSFEKCSSAAPCCDGLTCLDDASGEACKDGNCSCKPPCSGVDQSCGGTSACCEGLKCTTTSSGSVCKINVR